jgi:hypothetical protein
MSKSYWLPTIAYTLVDAINRMAAATGSVSSAGATHGADYNGHLVTFVPPNDFKRYWTCGYTWCGRHTIGRGSLEDCVRAAEYAYNRGHKGASAIVTIETDEDAVYLESRGWVPYSKEIAETHYRTFADERFDEVNDALRRGPVATGKLIQAETVEEYRTALQA